VQPVRHRWCLSPITSDTQPTAAADGGINMGSSTRQEVDALLDQLEQVGAGQQPRPLQNPLLWGNYNVAYTSTARAPSERGQREWCPRG
jgi:hypothetical protein